MPYGRDEFKPASPPGARALGWHDMTQTAIRLVQRLG